MLSYNIIKKIKALHSDMGGEYKALLPCLASQGIEVRFSFPYTHQQNGVSEHKHRHITEFGLTLLSQAKMPFIFC